MVATASTEHPIGCCLQPLGCFDDGKVAWVHGRLMSMIALLVGLRVMFLHFTLGLRWLRFQTDFQSLAVISIINPAPINAPPCCKNHSCFPHRHWDPDRRKSPGHHYDRIRRVLLASEGNVVCETKTVPYTRLTLLWPATIEIESQSIEWNWRMVEPRPQLGHCKCVELSTLSERPTFLWKIEPDSGGVLKLDPNDPRVLHGPLWAKSSYCLNQFVRKTRYMTIYKPASSLFGKHSSHLKPRSQRARRRAPTRQIILILKIVNVHIERVASKSNGWFSEALTRVDAVQYNMHGQMWSRRRASTWRHASRRVRCERGISVERQTWNVTYNRFSSSPGSVWANRALRSFCSEHIAWSERITV